MLQQDKSLNFGLLVALVLLGIFSLKLGTYNFSFGEIFAALFYANDVLGSNQVPFNIIINEIRLPRMLLGVVVGVVLGVSGAALQGLLKNPLAEPGVLGVSSSAALGAVVALYFGINLGNGFSVPILAMLGALLATGVLFAVARSDASILTLILVGVAINALAGAMTSLALNLSPNPFALSDIMLWLMGSLSNRSMADVWLLLPFAVLGLGLILSAKNALSAMTLGDDVAQTMGFNLASVQMRIIFGTAMAVGASVAAVGAVGFVGLVVPHILRPFVGHDPSRLLLPSALAGAILVLAADMTVRLLPGGQELRLGVVTAFVGAPFFLYLVIATRRQMR
jgi:iron complex transport system permease protein